MTTRTSRISLDGTATVNEDLIKKEENGDRLSTPQNLLLLFLYTLFTFVGNQ